MFKKGFTLAEVLITLGIVGVIAAITLPTLTQSTTTAQIGPKLAKAVSAFEQANKLLLKDGDVDLLSDTGVLETYDRYADALSNHMKTTFDGTNIVSKDGIGYVVSISNSSPSNTQIPAHKQFVGSVTIDINGPNVKPNASGTDVFNFSFWNDGSLRPKGATHWFGEGAVAGEDYHWTVKCPSGAIPEDPDFCAGHIFENNLKVLYK